MFQGEHDLFHGHVPLEDHPARIEQHEARHQAQDQMPVVSVFGACLTRFSSEEVLEDAEHLFDPVALIPGLNQPGDLEDRKSTRLNSSHLVISYAVFCLKKKK